MKSFAIEIVTINGQAVPVILGEFQTEQEACLFLQSISNPQNSRIFQVSVEVAA